MNNRTRGTSTAVRALACGLASLAAVLGLVPGSAATAKQPARTCDQHETPCFPLVSTIAFTSTRDNPTALPGTALEIYVMDGDGTNVRRLTNNLDGDVFATLSPDGTGKIVFDSNRARAPGEPGNTSDLFVMARDGSDQTLLTRGSSATWSPDSKRIAYHRSASGTGLPIRPGEPGAPTTDSDIFVLDDLDDVLAGAVAPRNLTNTDAAIDDDADWSPIGQQIAFVSKDRADNPNNSVTAEIYVLNADGTGGQVRLTTNAEEERAPAWSPDGTRIAFMCRRGGFDFEICLMNADGTGQVQLTDNTVPELTPTWSPDGQTIAFHTPLEGPNQFELHVINADASGRQQLTNTPGINGWANWGELRDVGWGH